MIRRAFAFAAMLGFSLSLASCTSLGVRPWERDLLAKPGMIFSSGLEESYDEHTYFSKEASSGGRGFSGGGCGCN